MYQLDANNFTTSKFALTGQKYDKILH